METIAPVTSQDSFQSTLSRRHREKSQESFYKPMETFSSRSQTLARTGVKAEVPRVPESWSKTMSRSQSKDVDRSDEKGMSRSMSRETADRTLPRNFGKETQRNTLMNKELTMPRSVSKEGHYEPFMFRSDTGEVGYMITEL